MSEENRKKTQHILSQPSPYFIALLYPVSPSLHCFIAVSPFVEFVLLTDDITSDKDCYKQQKTLYLIMWKSIIFVANL